MSVRKIAGLGALLALAACATGAPTRTARQAETPEILRGCWIARDGAETRLLRLLPDRQNPGVLGGQVSTYRQGAEAPAHNAVLGFEQDGSAAFVQPADKPMEQKTYRRTPYELMVHEGAETAYVAYSAGVTRLVAQVTRAGGDDTLTVMIIDLDRSVSMTLFRGRRDGCD